MTTKEERVDRRVFGLLVAVIVAVMCFLLWAVFLPVDDHASERRIRELPFTVACEAKGGAVVHSQWTGEIERCALP